MQRTFFHILLAFFFCMHAEVNLHAQSIEEIENSTFLIEELLSKANNSSNNKDRDSYASQALTIARGINYDGGIMRASIILGITASEDRKTEKALQHFLEAESKAQSSDNNAALARVYRAMGDLFAQEHLYGTSRSYYSKSLDLEPRHYSTMEKAADISLLDMRFDSAEYFYKELISKYRLENNNPKLVHIYQKLANAYNDNDNPGKGLYYYLYIEDIIEHYGSPSEKGMLYNNMGNQYAALFDYDKALEYFRKAELQCSYIPCDDPEVLFANMGIALHNLGKDDDALNYLQKARNLVASNNDKSSLASLEHLIAGVYFNSKDLYNALSHNEEAIRFAQESKERETLSKCYRTAADLHHELYDFEKAYEYYQKYLLLSDEIRFEKESRRQRIDQQRAMLATAEGQIRYLLTRQNIKDLELRNTQSEKEKLRLLNENLVLETERRDRELQLLQQEKEIDQAKQRELILQNLRSSQELRLASQQLAVEKQNRLIYELKQQEEIDRAQSLADSTSRAQEIELLKKDKELTAFQQDAFRQFAYGVGFLGLIILGLLGSGWWLARRTGVRLRAQNKKIEAQKELIEEERHKSDRLLLNILPGEIAQELRTRGHADPRYYESATVLFTDFMNFTKLSEQMSPEELIAELNECFLAFDEICEKHNLEKIKTIGDAYMCAGGLPIPNTQHPVDAVKAAREMMYWLERRNNENPNAVFRQMRIGVHTGPVIAGVVGKNKFAYDIWGDAVNLAARLEEWGQPGKINVSGATKDAVAYKFNASYRGKKEVHNKGLVDMYFIEEEIE
jgi:class 3 adenylate cyclase/tetratricopeptide (TPR) repeat protein